MKIEFFIFSLILNNFITCIAEGIGIEEHSAEECSLVVLFTSSLAVESKIKIKFSVLY